MENRNKVQSVSVGSVDRYEGIVSKIEKLYPNRSYRITSGRRVFEGFTKDKDGKLIKAKSVSHSYTGNYKGLHLIKSLENNLRKRILSGAYSLEEGYAKNRYNSHGNYAHYSIFNNTDNLLKAYRSNAPMYEVDIDQCYWKTAHLLGMIDLHTYNSGLISSKGDDKKKEWKDGRLVAIGNLGSKFAFREVRDNVPLTYLNDDFCYLSNVFAPYRMRIIDEVFKIGLRIADQVGEDFLMFLTDAFFVSSEDARNRIILELNNLGYEYKTKEYKVKKFSQKQGDIEVTWKNKMGGMHFSPRNSIVNQRWEFNQIKSTKLIQ